MRPSFAQLAATLALLAAFASAAPSPARRARDVRPVRTATARALRALLQRPDTDSHAVDPDRSRAADASGDRCQIPPANADGPDLPLTAPPRPPLVGRDTTGSLLHPSTAPAQARPAHPPACAPRGPPVPA